MNTTRTYNRQIGRTVELDTRNMDDFVTWMRCQLDDNSKTYGFSYSAHVFEGDYKAVPPEERQYKDRYYLTPSKSYISVPLPAMIGSALFSMWKTDGYKFKGMRSAKTIHAYLYDNINEYREEYTAQDASQRLMNQAATLDATATWLDEVTTRLNQLPQDYLGVDGMAKAAETFASTHELMVLLRQKLQAPILSAALEEVETNRAEASKQYEANARRW